MARVRVASLAAGYCVDKQTGRPRPDALHTVNTTVYAAATGGTTIPAPSFLTNDEGLLPGYLEVGSWELTDPDGDMVEIEVFSGLDSGRLDAVESNRALKANLWVNAKDYGAVGDDGTDDDLEALQDANDYLETMGGGVLFVPQGYYGLSGSFGQGNNVTVLGEGPGHDSPEFSLRPTGVVSEFRHLGDADFPLFTNKDTVDGNTGLGVKGVRFNMNAALADVAAIKWQMIRRSLITGLFIQALDTLASQPTSRYGIHIVNGEMLRILDDVNLYNCGIRGDTVNAITIRDTEIAQAGIYLSGGYYNQIVGNQVYSDNVATGTDYAAWRNGIVLNGCDEGIVMRNEVASFRHDGVYLLSSRRCKVTHNDILNNSKLLAGTWGGVLLDCDGTTCEENLVAHNNLNDRQGTKTQQFGVRIYQSAGSTKNNRIVDNNMRGNLAAAPIQIGAGVGPNEIARNDGYPHVVGKTGTYTATDADRVVIADAGGGAFTVTLPTPVGRQGREVTVKRANSGGNAVTVSTPAGTIDGAASKVLGSDQAFVGMVSDDAHWRIISQEGTVT